MEHNRRVRRVKLSTCYQPFVTVVLLRWYDQAFAAVKDLALQFEKQAKL